METLPELVARDRRSDRPALRTADREMDYRRVCTTAWKASNYLRHLGVGGSRGVAVLADRSAASLLTFLGAALLDTPTRFAESVEDLPGAVDSVDARAVLVPAAHEADVEPPAGTTLVTHGEAPDAATTENWAEGVWSENPAFVPSSATPESVALVAEQGPVTHGALLAAAESVVTREGIGEDDAVGVEGSLADPGVVAAVLAPLVVGGCAVLDGGADTVVDAAAVVGSVE